VIQRKRIGDILVDDGLITREQLDAAVAGQKGTREKLGRLLVSTGVVTEEQLLECLGRQLDIDRYAPDRYPLDPTLAEVVSPRLAQQLQLVPLRQQQNLLLVAMPNPTDVAAIDQVERDTGLEVEPVICSETELAQLTGGLYGSSGQFNEMLETFETPEVLAEDDEDRVHEVLSETVTDAATGAPVIRMVNWLISQAIRLRASDIHINPDVEFIRIRFRIDGRLRDMPSPPRAMFLPIVSRLKLLAHMDIATARVPQDGRFTARLDGRDFNLRVSSVPTLYGENLVLRVLASDRGPQTFESLGISPEDEAVINAALARPWGMILACGPTGSGKSTTLSTMLRQLNATESNIMTLEDPVEYRVPRVQQVQINHRAGMSFAHGLRAMLRQDPDVIMVGEIRDAETAAIAVQAAQTGHLVLSTVHTNDAVGAVARLVDMGVPPFLVSSVMVLAISQRLVRRVCRDCGAPTPPPDAAVLASLGLSAAAAGGCRRGRGCNVCLDTGYLGRAGLYEFLRLDDELRRLIAQGTPALELTRVATQRGLLSNLARDAGRKVAQGQTTAEEAMSAVML
jgi:type IV pilus assembly protein PilB